MQFKFPWSAATLAAAVLLAGGASAQSLSGDLKIFLDTSNPAPRATMEAMISKFQEKHPDLNIETTVIDREEYKTQIRNFLTANPPDVATWYAANRMRPYVEANLFEDVSDLWQEPEIAENLASTKGAMTLGGKQWGVPYTYYQWGIYYRADIFEEQGIAPPETWAELLEACARLKAAGITPFAIGTKALWPTGGWFDYLNLRVNGYEFHMDLTAGKVPYTDERVKAVFARWAELVEPGYFIDNHAALDWQDAVPLFVQGKAAMYLMGNFAVATMRDGGLKDEQIGFLQFPEITPGLPKAEDAPTDTLHIPAKADNKEDARKFLAFLATAEVQTAINKTLGQLPVNNLSEPPQDRILRQGFEMLSKAHALAQFYDRDAPAGMAKAGMEGFQEFMVKPDKVDRILARLEKVRARVHK